MKDWLNKEVGADDLERHDKWLCMIWPRLNLLKGLLSDDGVLICAIDHNEQEHLGLILYWFDLKIHDFFSQKS